MQRWFFVVLAIAFFVCLVQARPAQDETTTANQIQDEFTKIMNNVKEGFDKFANDPKVQDIVKQGQEFFQNAANQIKAEADKLMPKTDGTAA